MLLIFLTCIPVTLVARDPDSEMLTTCLVIFIKFSTSVIFFAINLQSMEVYPTCLRQSGIAAGAIAANTLSAFGPYIVYLGTEYDVRYPYYVLGMRCTLVVFTKNNFIPKQKLFVSLGALGLIGFFAAMLLPETLHHKLPNTLHEAKKFGKEQVERNGIDFLIEN